MSTDKLQVQVEEALAAQPTSSGGIAVVLATAGSPPAVALLSSGDVLVSGRVARVGIYGSSSAVTRLGGAFTLLVPLGESAARVEVTSATAEKFPPLALIEGQIESMRPTTEPPWFLEMNFVPKPPDHPSIPDFLDYWKQVRGWLSGERGVPDHLPG